MGKPSVNEQKRESHPFLVWHFRDLHTQIGKDRSGGKTNIHNHGMTKMYAGAAKL